jgi:hypothetical protein
MHRNYGLMDFAAVDIADRSVWHMGDTYEQSAVSYKLTRGA